MTSHAPTGPDRLRLLTAAACLGWAAALLGTAAVAAVDHAAGGTASELRRGALAGLALALALPWSRFVDRPRRHGPPRPVRAALALGALAGAVPAAILPLLPTAVTGSAPAAAVLGLGGVLLLAVPALLLFRAGARGAAVAGLAGAVVADLAAPLLVTTVSACHAAATALLVAACLALRCAPELRAVPAQRLPGAGSPWSGALAATGVVLVLALAPRLGWAPLGKVHDAVLFAWVLLALAGSPSGHMPRGAALAAGMLLAHVLGLGGGTGLRAAIAAPGRPAVVWTDGVPAELRVLQHAGDQVLAYDRATQELSLLDGDARVDGHGPDRNHGALAGLVAAALTAPGGRTQVHDCLQAAVVLRDLGHVDLRESVGDPWRAELTLRARLHGPVPVPAAGPAGAPVPESSCLRRELRTTAADSLGALVVGVPGPRALYAADHEFHAEARRALGTGPLVVPMPIDRVAPELLRATCAAARTVHTHVELLLVRDVLLLVATGSAVPWRELHQQPPVADRWWWSVGASGPGDLAHAVVPAPWDAGPSGPPDARVLAAGAAAAARDSDSSRTRASVAFLRTAVRQAGPGFLARLWLRDRTGDSDALAVEASVQLRAERAGSHLLHDELRHSRLRAAVAAVCAADPTDAPSVHRAAVAAAAWCHVGAPHAILQAALGLPNQAGGSVQEPQAAARLALALDPTLASTHPPVLQAVFGDPSAGTGALEDLALLPDLQRLAAACTGATARAVALRARFGPACAQALLAVREVRPWTLEELGALRELAAPGILDVAARRLADLGSPAEVLGLWRLDLPATRGIEVLAAGATESRLALARAMTRRKDFLATRILATLLVDVDPGVRAAAGDALDRSWSGTVAYDPAWERSRLEAAAQALLALHNRRP